MDICKLKIFEENVIMIVTQIILAICRHAAPLINQPLVEEGIIV